MTANPAGALRVAIDVRPAESARVGGTSKYVENLVRALHRDGAERHLVLVAGRGDAPNRLQDLAAAPGVTWVGTRRRRQTARIQLELPALLARHRVDVFHSPGLFVPLAWRGPIVLSVHDLNVLKRPLDWASPREAMRWLEMAPNLPVGLLRGDLLIAASEHVGAQLRRLLQRRAGRVRVQLMGPGLPVEPRRSPPGTDGGKFILHVGEVARRKNLELLVRSFAESDLAEEGIQLVLAGPDRGGYAGALRRMARDLGIGPAVRVAGVVADDELRALYQDALAVIVPSVREGFGLTAVEAMTAGTPVVAARAGSLPEVLAGAGLLFEPADPGALTRRLRQVAHDPAIRGSLSARGLARSDAFEWARCAEGTARLYEEAVASRRAEAASR